MSDNSVSVLSSKGLTREFGSGKKLVKAVNDVAFDFREGEIVSVVGESGSGKTTLMLMLMGLLNQTHGDILYRGQPIHVRKKREMRAYWQNVQAIFQDPFSSFNQFFRISKIFEDCLRFKGVKLSKETGSKSSNVRAAL